MCLSLLESRQASRSQWILCHLSIAVPNFTAAYAAEATDICGWQCHMRVPVGVTWVTALGLVPLFTPEKEAKLQARSPLLCSMSNTRCAAP